MEFVFQIVSGHDAIHFTTREHHTASHSLVQHSSRQFCRCIPYVKLAGLRFNAQNYPRKKDAEKITWNLKTKKYCENVFLTADKYK